MSLETIVLLPAGMKPMHGGHLDLIKRYSNHADVKEIRILIGPSKRDFIDQDLSIEIAKFLTRDIKNVKIIATNHPTPVTSLYKYMETVKCGNYALGASTKNNDFKTVTKFVENFSESGKYFNTLPDCVNVVELNLDCNPIIYRSRIDEYNKPISASVVRKDIENNDLNLFITNYPGIKREDVVTVWNMIISKTRNSDNLHMEHIEDLMFNDGLAGIVKCKSFYEKIYNTLTKKKEEVSISTKYDGSPAIFCWSVFPGLPNNSIAIKGLFNSTPEIFTSISDIADSKKPIDLMRKLIRLFMYLPNLAIPENEIWQGDIMYDKDSLNTEYINGFTTLVFHPNTILYSPKLQKDYEKLKYSKLGLVWHTIYTGDSLKNIKCHYNVNIKKLSYIEEIFTINPKIKYENLSSMDLSYTDDIDYIKRTNFFIKNSNYIELISNKEVVNYLTLFYNNLIREDCIISHTEFVDRFKSFIRSKSIKIIESKKTEQKQIEYQHKFNELLDLIENNRIILKILHYHRKKLSGLKTAFINELDKYSTMYTYFKTHDGNFIKTNHEGYAINDGYNVVKLVNRYEFSKSNFSNEYVKGWTNEKRTT